MVSDARRRKGGVGDGEFLLPGFNRPKGMYSEQKYASICFEMRKLLQKSTLNITSDYEGNRLVFLIIDQC